MIIKVRALVSQLNTGAKRAKVTIFRNGQQFSSWLNYKDRTKDTVRVGHFITLEVDEAWVEQELQGEGA